MLASLEYLDHTYKSDGYGGGSYRWSPIAYPSLIRKMFIAAKEDSHAGGPPENRLRAVSITGVISTVCDRGEERRRWLGFLPRRAERLRHLYGADCDSIESASAAIEHLNDMGVSGVAVIESSPGRFWVIADILGSFEEVLSQVEETPGSDHEHVKQSRAMKRITFRALPKARGYPRLIEDRLRLPQACRWLDLFMAHFDAPEMQGVMKQMQISRLLLRERRHDDVSELRRSLFTKEFEEKTG